MAGLRACAASAGPLSLGMVSSSELPSGTLPSDAHRRRSSGAASHAPKCESQLTTVHASHGATMPQNTQSGNQSTKPISSGKVIAVQRAVSDRIAGGREPHAQREQCLRRPDFTTGSSGMAVVICPA